MCSPSPEQVTNPVIYHWYKKQMSRAQESFLFSRSHTHTHPSTHTHTHTDTHTATHSNTYTHTATHTAPHTNTYLRTHTHTRPHTALGVALLALHTHAGVDKSQGCKGGTEVELIEMNFKGGGAN